MICEERSGFLFAHACDRTAVWQCSQCGKNICYEHTRMGEGGNTCIACVRPSAARRTERNEEEYDDTSDDPYFYAYDGYDSDYYDADDYGAFDSSGETGDSDAGDFAAS